MGRVSELLNIAAGVDSGNLAKEELEVACRDYLEALGYACLRKHTEAPIEEGDYIVVVQGMSLSAWRARREKAAQDLKYWGDKLSAYAIGPLPEKPAVTSVRTKE